MALNVRAFVNRDVTYSVASQVFVSGLNFAVGIIAARVLGVTDFGLFALILMMASFTSSFAETLITRPMMTLAGSRAKRSDSYFSSIIMLGLATATLSALAIGLFVVALFGLRGEFADSGLFLAAAFITFSQNIQNIVHFVLFAKRKLKQALCMEILHLGIMAVVIGYLLSYNATVDVATGLNVLAASALISALPFICAGLKARVHLRLLFTVLRRHWPISSWLLLMLLVGVGQEQALWVITNIKFGDEAIGGLRASQYLLGTTHFLVFALENFMPRTAAEEMRKDNVSGLTKYLVTQTKFVGLTSLVLIIPIAIFAEPLLGLVFGQEYVAYADLTRIFALIYAVTIIRGIWIYYLRVVERTRDIFISYVVSSAISLLIIFPMISWFGLTGVALTMLVAQSVLLIAVAIFIVRHGLNPPRHIPPGDRSIATPGALRKQT